MNIGQHLESVSRRLPHHPAVIGQGTTRSYAELQDRVSRARTVLHRMGVRPGDRVVLFMANSSALLELMYASWQAGAVAVPLNARFIGSDVAYHLADSEARLIAVDAERVPLLADDVVGHTQVLVVGDRTRNSYEYQLRDAAIEAPIVDRDPDSPAWLFYTSGTTGRPKGAVLSHRVLNFVVVSWCADLMNLGPSDVGLHAAPLSHGSGFYALALTARGATQVLLEGKFSPAAVLGAVDQYGVTNTWMVPTQLRMVCEEGDFERWSAVSLHTLVYGGAPMYVEDLKSALGRLGPILVQIFAQGETPMTATHLTAADHQRALAAGNDELLGSCGFARTGMQVAILNDDDQVLSAGEIGEICVRGPAVFSGYWRRPSDSQAALRGGWLHTGDIGLMDEHGYVFIKDRRKDMVISGGTNIYPREIEEVLLQHPDVDQAAVVGIPDRKWGETAVAAIVLRRGSSTTADSVAEFAGGRLAGFKRPKSIVLVADLPKSAYGKVLKRELRTSLTRRIQDG